MLLLAQIASRLESTTGRGSCRVYIMTGGLLQGAKVEVKSMVALNGPS